MSVRLRLRLRTSGLGLRPLQDAFEVCQVVVVEHAELCAGEAGGIHDAGMDQLIEDDDVVRADQRADGAESCGVAGGEAERGGGAFERGERFFEFVVGRQRAADQARGASAGAKAFDGLDGSFLEGGLIGQTQVIVGREVEQGPAPQLRYVGTGAYPRAAVHGKPLLAEACQWR